MPHFSFLTSRKGFTLLELIITVTLLGIMVLIISGALRLGIRAWEKGEEKAAVIEPPIRVLQLMERQIASTLPYQFKKAGKKFPLFDGGPDRLEFVSLSPLAPRQGADAVHIVYSVHPNANKGVDLFFFEEALSAFDATAEKADDSPGSRHGMLGGVYAVSFEYAASIETADELVWETQWRPGEQKGVPAAVKITLTTDPAGAPFSLIVRISAEMPVAALQLQPEDHGRREGASQAKVSFLPPDKRGAIPNCG